MKTKEEIKKRIEKLEVKVKEFENTEYDEFTESINEEILTLKWVIS